MRHAFEIVRRWVKRVEEWLVNVLTIYKNHLVCLIVAPLWSPVQAEWKGFKACHWLTVRLRLLPLLPFALSPSHFTSPPPCLLFSLSLSLYSLYLYLPLPLTYTQTHTQKQWEWKCRSRRVATDGFSVSSGSSGGGGDFCGCSWELRDAVGLKSERVAGRRGGRWLEADG